MSLCINPKCSKPENSDHNRYCQKCGSDLLLAGRYRVLRLLSNKGGFGYTYEVVEQNTPKVLKVLINNQPHAVQLFQQEALVLQQLNHPGIPKGESSFIYHPRDSEAPLHCLVMEKVEGIDLEEYQQQNNDRAIDQTLALDWLSQLIHILHEVHQRQFFHRDIKPSNIILKPNGQLVLIDFGAARQVTATILAGEKNTGIYTPGYAPPEQQRGHSVPQSDFYALGRTFVFLLTGKEPNNPQIYDYQHNELKWRNYAPQITTELADFLDHLMAEKLIERPANTNVILRQLEKLQQDLSVTRQKTLKLLNYVKTITKPLTRSSSNTISQSATQSQPTIVSQKEPVQSLTTTYAGFWIRLKASIIDSLILIIVAALLGSYLGIKIEQLDLLKQFSLDLGNYAKDLKIYAAILVALGTTTPGLILAGYEIFILGSHYQIILNYPIDIAILSALLVGIILKWLYFTLFEYSLKGTIGKLFFGLVVTDINGRRLSLKKANRRYCNKLFSYISLYIGFMLAGWTPRKRALHDFLTGTLVIRRKSE